MNRQSTLVHEFNWNVAKIWTVVTNNLNYSWRSDIDHIEVVNSTTFIEYYKAGGETLFIITEQNKNKVYSFRMENKVFAGEWIGKFIEINKSTTQLIFTENLKFKNIVYGIMSYLFFDLKKMQQQYMSDLEVRLNDGN